MIKLGWREYVKPTKGDQLAVGIADVAFIGEECFSEPIEILLMTNDVQIPIVIEEKRQIQESDLLSIQSTSHSMKRRMTSYT